MSHYISDENPNPNNKRALDVDWFKTVCSCASPLIVLESVVISVLGSLARFPSTLENENYGIHTALKKMLDGNTKRTRNAMENNLCNFAPPKEAERK